MRLSVMVVMLIRFTTSTPSQRYSVGVFGATPGGIAAALSAVEDGRHDVTLLMMSHDTMLGGMMASGLGWDDLEGSVRPASIYGNSSYTHFANQVQRHYEQIGMQAQRLSVNGTRHEPSVAQTIFEKMLKEKNIRVEVIDEVIGATVNMAGTIQSITVASSSRPRARREQSSDFCDRSNKETKTLNFDVIVEASYLGDILAITDTPFRVGRESRSEYGEINAGVVYTDNIKESFIRGSTGEASPKVPAMSWRLCFTTNASNMVNVTSPPSNYNRSIYLGYVDDVNFGRIDSVWNAWSGPRQLPPTGTKFDINCNPRPLGFIWTGPQKELLISANCSERVKLIADLRDRALGLLYFQQNDLSVPSTVRVYARSFGLCKDEFEDTMHFPPQLYVREARRLRSIRQFTERDMIPSNPDGRPPIRPDACAIGTFAIDAFPASDLLPAKSQQSASTAQEGYISMESDLVSPNTLPFGMMLAPNRTNLVVAVPVGATHVAFSSIRLEPTWMLLGDAAGKLAALWTRNTSILDIPLLKIQKKVVQTQPLIKYNDLSPQDESYFELQVLGPHGVAEESNWTVSGSDMLMRGCGTRWLFGALLAMNSTVGTIYPVPTSNSTGGWADFHPGDLYFDTAVLCSKLGIFPGPNVSIAFRPSDPITYDTWYEWINKAFGMHKSMHVLNNNNLSRAIAAKILLNSTI